MEEATQNVKFHMLKKNLFLKQNRHFGRGFQKRGGGTSRGYGRVRGTGGGFGRRTQRNWKNDKDKPNKNPQNSSGKFTKCLICKTIYHWIIDCPHLEEVEHTDGTEETNVASSMEKKERNVVLFVKGIKSIIMELC